MAGTFPGIANCQQQDANGEPLNGGILTVYNVDGTQASVFQDIGLAIPGPNPMPLDITGRVPMFFVDDGTYRVRLTDSSGVTSNGGFDLLQVPSIGASTSGGGGSSVDPTTVASTGWVIWQPIQGIISGWVRMNGRTIGNAVSGATERANSDTQALFVYAWTKFSDSICPVVGGRGDSGLADFNAGKQITLLSMRGVMPVGLDDMGNTAAGLFSGVPFTSGSETAAGSLGGENLHALAKTELPVLGLSVNINDPGHFHAVNAALRDDSGKGGINGSGGGGDASRQTDTKTTGITASIPEIGGGQSHNNMSLFMTGTWFWKL